MSARGHPTTAGMMWHGPPPLNHPELTAQIEEMDRLLEENRRLATSIRAMRQDLGSTQDEIKGLSSHIRSTETESDIQIRVLLEKIGKMESSIKAGDGLKKDLQQAHMEVQSLVAGKKELMLRIQKASQELEMCRSDIKNIPDMISEVDSMRTEHQRLRSAFEHEKRINIDLVERMQSMEENLIGMSREAETLRAEIQRAEQRAQAPYDGAYPNSDPQYSTLYRRSDPYYDPYRRAPVLTETNGTMEGLVPHGKANGPLPSTGIGPSPPVSGASAPMNWRGPYDPSTAPK